MNLKDLLKIWRIILLIFVFGLIGGIIGYFINFHYSAFFRFWVGGAVSEFVGFSFGLLWQISNTTRRKETPIFITLFIGMLTIILLATAIFHELPRMNKEMQLLNKLKSIGNTQIEKIEIFSEDGNDRIKIINDAKVIAEFTSACGKIKGFSPNHPEHITA